LRHRSATTAVVLNDFNEKGVIEIIFIDEILAKFLCCEDGSGSTTSLVCTTLIGFSHILWCGLLLYPTARAMREASSIG
jgi:hypothetical protein